MGLAGKIRWGQLAGLLLAMTIILACAPATRHKVLCFFFDGVPDGKTPSGGAVAKVREPSVFHPLVAPYKPRPTPLPIVSVHKPVQERRCNVCHETERGYMPISMDEALCDRCHKEQRLREGWDHGPINLGTCIPCHRAHESPYPHLLDKPVPQVCMICHLEDIERKRKEHQVANINQCTACHDPHRMY
jgi:predicted CXXCH cytochrome family protein